MKKFHLTLAFIAVSAAIIGPIILAQNPIFWFVNNSIASQVFRILLITVIGAQLVTEPPRRAWLRAITGLMAIAAFAAGIIALGAARSPIVDVFVYLQSSAAIGIAALELQDHKSKRVYNADAV